MPAHIPWSERVRKSQPASKWGRLETKHIAIACAVAVVLTVPVVVLTTRPAGDRSGNRLVAGPQSKFSRLVEVAEIESVDVTPVFTATDGEIMWMIDEGSAVEAGETILRIDDTDRRTKLEEHERQTAPLRTELKRVEQELAAVRIVGPLRVRQAEVALAQAEWALETLRRKPTREELAAAKLDLTLAALARDRAIRDLGRIEELYERGLATDTELRQGRLEGLDGEANAHLAELHLEVVKRGPTTLELESARLKVDTARLAVEEARSSSVADNVIADQAVIVAQLRLAKSESYTERLREELADCSVTAPVAGRIAFVDAWKGSEEMSPIRVGETCRHGMLVAKVADPERMRAVLLVNEVDSLRLQPGMLATVRLTAYPGVAVTGHVVKIGARAVDKNERLGHLALRKSGHAGINVVEVHVDLDERPEAMRGGHTATVVIDLESPPTVRDSDGEDPDA